MATDPDDNRTLDLFGRVSEARPGAIHLGDCLPWLRSLPDESVDAVVTDPPYGLSKPPDIAEVLRHWLAGDDYRHGSPRKGHQNCLSNLARISVWDPNHPKPNPGALGVNGGIALRLVGLPVVAAVDLNDGEQGGNEQVDGPEVVPIADDVLLDDHMACLPEDVGDLVLDLRPLDGAPACVGACTCFSLPKEAVGSVPVWARFVDTESPAGEVALAGTEVRAVLRLDLRRRTVEVLAAQGAGESDPAFLLLVRAHPVGTLSGARRLAAMPKAGRVGLVVDAAHGARTGDRGVAPPVAGSAGDGAGDHSCLRRAEGLTANGALLLHEKLRSRVMNPTNPAGGFMQRAWDSFVPGPSVWREVYRVLKPGGHAVVFAGSRTSDLMGLALRFAGFEVRDSIGWQYWSGFPKSLDVSKAIDKWGSSAGYGVELRRLREQAGHTADDLARLLGWPSAASVKDYETGGHAPPLERQRQLWSLYGLAAPGEAWFEREVVATCTNGIAGGTGTHAGTAEAYGFGGAFDITAPATPDAARWSGFGTALKPCIEPAWLVRRPLREGSIARQVLATGTGALNIDGCRYAYGDSAWPGPDSGPDAINAKHAGMDLGEYDRPPGISLNLSLNPMPLQAAHAHALGRWPANVYACAKASRTERERGCDDLPARAGFEAVDREEGSAGLNSPRTGAGRSASSVRNHHPTVKPVRLMRWLCRLVTPPGGLVLDPFAGSGTTGIAAALEGFAFGGAELGDEYHAIATARIAHAQRWPASWADTTPGAACEADDSIEAVERVGQVGLFAALHPDAEARLRADVVRIVGGGHD